MRHLLAVTAAGLLFVSGAAFAQSGQGGALGKNPSPAPSTGSMNQPPMHQGSGQGGYTGQNPGAGATSSGSTGTTQGSGQGGAIGTNPSGPGGNPAYTGQQQPPYGSQQTPPRR